MSKRPVRLDQVGYWSEIKLDIVRKYASAYSTIMARQSSIKRHIYIDAFAGAGQHISKTTGQFVQGSPLNALHVTPPFKELHLIDLDGQRVDELQKLTAGDTRVTVHRGDCNDVLLREVFPRCQYRERHRALCLLDPYGLSVNWDVLRTAGHMKSVEVFYNFMIMDANMNVFMRDPSKVTLEQAARMDAVWGDNSWRSAAYRKRTDLFGELEEKATNEEIAEAFRTRLRDVAGFTYVPRPMPMRNEKGAVIYYMYFASPNNTGAKIVSEIFNTYRTRGAH
jgi:three-Cys-motif partner protein